MSGTLLIQTDLPSCHDRIDTSWLYLEECYNMINSYDLIIFGKEAPNWLAKLLANTIHMIDELDFFFVDTLLGAIVLIVLINLIMNKVAKTWHERKTHTKKKKK